MATPKHYRLNHRIISATVLLIIVSFVLIAYTFFLNTDGFRRTLAFFEARILTHGYTADSNLDSLPMMLGEARIAYTLYDVDGNVLWKSANLERPLPSRPFIMSRHWLQRPGKYFSGKVLIVPAFLQDGTTMMVSKQDPEERALLQTLMQERLYNSLLLLIPVIILAVTILMPLLLLWILRPIRLAAEVAAEIGPHDLEQRIPLEGLPGEVIPLADAANHALDRLTDAYQTEKSFVMDAAHELRTPLTILDLHIQEIQQYGETDITAMLRQRDQMRQLVEQLLSLAKLENQHLSCAQMPTVNLIELLQDCIDTQRLLFAKQQREIHFIPPDYAIYCKGQDDQLATVINNLINNALIHGKGNTEVRLELQESNVILDIIDEGADLPFHQASQMFSRFKKRVANTPGTGLGLAIVKQIVHNCGGSVAFIDSDTTCIRVQLPLAETPLPQGKENSSIF